MITDELINKVKSQGFDESLFWDACSFVFQKEYGVTVDNELPTATKEQLEWAEYYLIEYDGQEGLFCGSIINESMYEDARSMGMAKRTNL